ncbi:MAG: nucleoside triphosphate pyrophosphohydrolase family protein [Prevotella sp.]|nr:nucleoside triphosphate pyrophosphohydrolase family protein [Prevotella sp.]
MEMNEYQEQALSTAVYPQALRIVYPALGLAGETGEVADKVKKEVRDRAAAFSPETRVEIAKELGDVMWYIAAMAHDLGFSLEEIAQMNVAKVFSRKNRNQIHGEGDNR